MFDGCLFSSAMRNSAIFRRVLESGFKNATMALSMPLYMYIGQYRPSMCGVYTHCAACAPRQWVSECYIISHIAPQIYVSINTVLTSCVYIFSDKTKMSSNQMSDVVILFYLIEMTKKRGSQ